MNNEFYAETKSRRNHLFNHSCILVGKYTNETEQVEIKISAISCLGKREWKLSEKSTHGCLPIKMMYEIGDYNVFVRPKPSKRLSELILDENFGSIDPRKCISDLARILNNMHEQKMFVRFIVPNNIVFFANADGQLDVLFEEYNTIKFEDKLTSDYSESSGEEFVNIMSDLNLRKNQVINTSKNYTVNDEIKSLGFVIREIGESSGLTDLYKLGEAVSSVLHPLEQIEFHPILQTTEKYFSYVVTLANWISTSKANRMKFKEVSNEKGIKMDSSDSLVFFDEVVTLYNKNCTLEDWKPELSFINAPSPASFITTLAHIYKNGHTVYLNWKDHEYCSSSFNDKLRMKTTSAIIKIHQVVVKMNIDPRDKESLCIPS